MEVLHVVVRAIALFDGRMYAPRRGGQGETRRLPLRLASFDLGGEELVVVSFALQEASGDAALSPAEREVARLMIVGLSNEQIAAARGTSRRTVANQAVSIFKKIGVGSRLELAGAFELAVADGSRA